MNNYTIDPSVFFVSEIEFKNADEKGKGTMVKNICRNIERYLNLRSSQDNSVFFPTFNTGEFLEKLKSNIFLDRQYQKKIEELLDGHYQYSDFVQQLYKIIQFYQVEDGEPQKDWRESFSNQFDIQQIWVSDIILVDEPENKILEAYSQNFIKTLSSIALLNKHLYGNETSHLFVFSGLGQYEKLAIHAKIDTISIGNDELRPVIGDPKEINGVVRKKSLKGVKEKETKFEKLEAAVKDAQNDFSANLIFGNDVERGVKESDKTAGPPDKVYYYLKTLSEITEIKRNWHPSFSLVLLARMYGCICSGESSKIQNNANLMKHRTWHDGYSNRCFVDHLKPSDGYHLFGDTWDGQGIRIYFTWDKKSKKTIVGWIGKHPPTEEK